MRKLEREFTMIQRRGHRNLKQRFELLKTLGQGTYGKVKLAVETKTGRQVRNKLNAVASRHGACRSHDDLAISAEVDLGRVI